MIDNRPSGLQVRSQPVGALKINYVVYFFLTIILITPAYTYYMAVKHKQEPPFPHATVTNTACHYPQATIFRWTMTAAGGFLTLIFHVIFRYFEREAAKMGYTGGTYSYMYWPTMLSVLGYLAAIGTIDIDGTGSLHTGGAVYFFICLYFCVVNLTIVSRLMRNWETSFMTAGSLIQKLVVAIYLSIVWFYCLYGLITQAAYGPSNDDDKYIVIVEWNLVYAGLIWILCFLSDFKHVSLVLNDNRAGVAMAENK